MNWCSVYSGEGLGDTCGSAFVLYSTTPAMYQNCKYDWERKTCAIESKLRVCDDEPPSSPPSPLPPSSPSPMPPPMPPVLCPLLEQVSPNMVSIRDKLYPTWCSDHDWSREKCELSYIRAGNTYTRCIYHPRTDDDYASCEMEEGGWKSCLDDPPAPPAPPSMPSTCPAAANFGFSNDLRKVPLTHFFSERHADTFIDGDRYEDTGYTIPGIHEMAVCDFYSGGHASDLFNVASTVSLKSIASTWLATHRWAGGQAEFCKHSYQTDGLTWYPCLWRNVSRGGEYVVSCSASPTAKLC